MPARVRAHSTSCGWFWAWAVVGCALALAAVSLGVLALAPAALAVVALSSRPAARRSAFGLFSGVGVLLLYVAWVQRAGPGTTCWRTASASGCGQHLNPLPWAIAGLVSFAVGIVGHARRA